MDNNFEKSIFDRLLHMGFCEFNKNPRTHRSVQIEFSCRKIQITGSGIELWINWRRITSDFLSLIHSVSKGIDFKLIYLWEGDS